MGTSFMWEMAKLLPHPTLLSSPFVALKCLLPDLKSLLIGLFHFIEFRSLSFFAILLILLLISSDFLFSSKWLAMILNRTGSGIYVHETRQFHDNFLLALTFGNLPATQFLICLICVLIGFCIQSGFPAPQM